MLFSNEKALLLSKRNCMKDLGTIKVAPLDVDAEESRDIKTHSVDGDEGASSVFSPMAGRRYLWMLCNREMREELVVGDSGSSQCCRPTVLASFDCPAEDESDCLSGTSKVKETVELCGRGKGKENNGEDEDPVLSTEALCAYIRSLVTVYRYTLQGLVPSADLLRHVAELLDLNKVGPLLTRNPCLVSLVTGIDTGLFVDSENQQQKSPHHFYNDGETSGWLPRFRREIASRRVLVQRLAAASCPSGTEFGSGSKCRASGIHKPEIHNMAETATAGASNPTEENETLRAGLEERLLRLRPFQSLVKQQCALPVPQLLRVPGLKEEKTPFDRGKPPTCPVAFLKVAKACQRQLRCVHPKDQLIQARLSAVYGDLPVYATAFIARSEWKRETCEALAKGAARRLDELLKQKQLRLERDRRERMKYLKENDFDAYLEVVKASKDARIEELLKQTDHFLKTVLGKVRLQQSTTLQAQKAQAANGVLETPAGANLNHSATNPVCPAGFSGSHVDKPPHGGKEPASVSEGSAATASGVRVTVQPSLLSGGTLVPYQLAGLQFLVQLYDANLSGILADEMGLGKTVQTVALLAYLKENRGVEGPHLIIVPLSTLPNWVAELARWCPSLSVLQFRGNKSERRQLSRKVREARFNVCVTTYEWVLRERGALASPFWTFIIVDEGHKMKNIRGKFHATLSDFKSTHRLLLTGTPLQNNISELWSLLNFLLPKIFTSATDFELWFQEPFKDFPGAATTGGDPVAMHATELTEEEKILIINRLHAVLRPFLLRRVKEDVLDDLPDKREHVVRVQLSAWQRQAYARLSRKAICTPTTDGKMSRRSFANVMMQLRKIVNHPYLFEDEYFINDNLFRVSGKFEVLDRMLPKLIHFKHKTLIFCQMTQVMNILDDYLEYRGHKRCRLDGGTVMEDRRERMAEFNDPASDTYIFTLSTRAGGLGINLQAADTVILFDSDWNPHQDLQAQARAHRFGQKKEVRVFRLVTVSGIEEAVLSKAQHKLDIDEKIIQAGMFNNKCTDEERQRRLRCLLYSKGMGTQTCVTTPQQLNRYLARNLEEEAFFEEYDRQLLGDDIYDAFAQVKELPFQGKPGSSGDVIATNESPGVAPVEKQTPSSTSGGGAATGTTFSLDPSPVERDETPPPGSGSIQRYSPVSPLESRQDYCALGPKSSELGHKVWVGYSMVKASASPATLLTPSIPGEDLLIRSGRLMETKEIPENWCWDHDTEFASSIEGGLSPSLLTAEGEGSSGRDAATGSSLKQTLSDDGPTSTGGNLIRFSLRSSRMRPLRVGGTVARTGLLSPYNSSGLGIWLESLGRDTSGAAAVSAFSGLATDGLSEAGFDRVIRALEDGEAPDIETALTLERSRLELRKRPSPGRSKRHTHSKKGTAKNQRRQRQRIENAQEPTPPTDLKGDTSCPQATIQKPSVWHFENLALGDIPLSEQTCSKADNSLQLDDKKTMLCSSPSALCCYDGKEAEDEGL